MQIGPANPTVNAASPASIVDRSAVRRASIDIGTNSVKVLVADVDGRQITTVWEASEQTRLGRGFYETHQLQPAAIQLTAECVARFVQEARTQGATTVRALATSAARDAQNSEEFRAAIRTSAGLEVEIISGDLEAELSFAGVLSRDSVAGSILALDVGGGSTEFMLGSPAGLTFRSSIALGSVRLLEKFGSTEVPAPEDLARVRGYLAELLAAPEHGNILTNIAEQKPTAVLGVGGTTIILALVHHANSSFDLELAESTLFTRPVLSGLIEKLWSMPLTARRMLPGLPPERADVILYGATIYEAILKATGLPALGVGTRGLRYGALIR